MTKVIKHINFTESQASKILSPKGKEIITLQLLEQDPRRTSNKLTQVFENMVDMPLIYLAGAAVTLYAETLPGPIDYLLSDYGLNTYYLCTRNHLLEVDGAKIIIKQRLEEESSELQQLIYFSIFGSLVSDADTDIIRDPVLTGPAIMALTPYFNAKYDTIAYQPSAADLMFYIREHLNMGDRPFSAIFSKPAILAFGSTLNNYLPTFNDWIIDNIPEEDRISFSANCAERLQGLYEHVLEAIDWPLP